jgi:hypothetical protein
VLERLHAAPSSANAKDAQSADILSSVTFPPIPPCLRPLGKLIVSPVLWQLLATLFDTACEHLLGDAAADAAAAQAGQLLWVNDTCIQQACALSFSFWLFCFFLSCFFFLVNDTCIQQTCAFFFALFCFSFFLVFIS